MNTFWFLLTLIIDIIPFVILSTFLLKEYLPCSFPAGLAKIVIPLVAYDVLICVTYIQVWITCIISQFVLNIAMMLTLRTDYAENGVEPKAFFLQIIMTTASMTITVIMYYGFKMSREVEISKEKQMRDELLLELKFQTVW